MPTTSEEWEEVNRMPTPARQDYYRAHTVQPSLSNALAQVRPPIVLTSENGHFAIPVEKRWGLYIVPMDVFMPQTTLIVKRDGYEPLLVWVRAWETTNIGEIFLKPIQK